MDNNRLPPIDGDYGVPEWKNLLAIFNTATGTVRHVIGREASEDMAYEMAMYVSDYYKTKIRNVDIIKIVFHGLDEIISGDNGKEFEEKHRKNLYTIIRSIEHQLIYGETFESDKIVIN